MALLDRSQVIVQIKSVVRASLHARPAPDTRVPIYVHDPIGPLRKGIHRANRHAGRVRAVIAALYQKVALDVGKLADFDVLHRRSEVPDRHVVFCLARSRARMTADAGVVINDKAVLHAMGFYT